MSATDVGSVTAQDMVVGIFDTHEQTERAIYRLIDAGIPLSAQRGRTALERLVDGGGQRVEPLAGLGALRAGQ